MRSLAILIVLCPVAANGDTFCYNNCIHPATMDFTLTIDELAPPSSYLVEYQNLQWLDDRIEPITTGHASAVFRFDLPWPILKPELQVRSPIYFDLDMEAYVALDVSANGLTWTELERFDKDHLWSQYPWLPSGVMTVLYWWPNDFRPDQIWIRWRGYTELDPAAVAFVDTRSAAERYTTLNLRARSGVPEPSTWLLACLTLGVVVAWNRKRIMARA